MTTTISALAAGATLTGTEVAPMDQGGATVKITAAHLFTDLAIAGIFSLTTPFSLASGSVNVTFDTVTLDTGAPSPFHAGATFNSITIPITGVYQINAAATFAANATGARSFSILTTAPLDLLDINDPVSSAAVGTFLSGSVIAPLAAGTVLQLQLSQNSGVNLNITAKLNIVRVA